MALQQGWMRRAYDDVLLLFCVLVLLTHFIRLPFQRPRICLDNGVKCCVGQKRDLDAP